MNQNTVIFVTDERQKGISDFLPGMVKTLVWTDEESERVCMEAIRNASTIVLPTPASKIKKNSDLIEMLKYNLINCKMLFGGVLDDTWHSLGKQNGFVCYDFMQDEQIAAENARITAQATIAEILKVARYEICGSKILITGFGRCARCLAKILSAMGAKITILARSNKARKEAKAMGYSAADFSYAPEEVYGAYIIVNTVPAQVVGARMFCEMHPDTVVIDIASSPGGCDLVAAGNHHIPVVSALSLPSKYMTKSSAKVFGTAIYRKTFRDFDQKEDKSWIFQILIQAME